MKPGRLVTWIGLAIYAGFIGLSLFLGYAPGVSIGRNFVDFAIAMLKVLPCAFVLIGLFEVWVKSETVERHLGAGSGLRGHLWAVLLAGTTVGGVYVAFPVAHSLFNKGARLGVIFTYIGAAGLCRVPMTIFEASFLGLPFSLVRLFVSLPLVVITASLLGRYLTKINYVITDGG